jgi:CDP-glucose 4,6-dehydratase
MLTDPFWNKKSVLVTGATGFLAGWLIRDLVERGAHVVALVRRNRPDSQLFLAGYDDRVTVVTGEVSDRPLLGEVIDRHQVDVVFHTAMSGGGVQATLAEPIQCLQSTVESTWWLLDILRQHHSQAVMVVCSSDKAYGEQETPYRETQPLQPRHPQEVAKASQDLLTQSFGKVYGLNVAVTRCGNFFGPYDFNFTRIIPYVARCNALGERPQLRSDGRFVRDFLSIEEASLAHIMLAQSLAERPELRGEAFNFSYEVEMTVAEIVARIMNGADPSLAPILGDVAQNEIPSMTLNCDKARTMLGWAPQLSFSESLAATTGWYKRWFRKVTVLVASIQSSAEAIDAGILAFVA